MKYWTFKIMFEPRDLWIGLYWNVKQIVAGDFIHFYICPIPMLVFHIYQTTNVLESRR